MRQLIPLAALLLLLPAVASTQTAAQLCAGGVRQYCSPPRPKPVIHHRVAPQQPQPAISEPVLAPPAEPRLAEVFQDAPDAPELVVIPPGAFTMGSPASERGRGPDEGPQHRVTIGYALAVGAYDVTRDQYAAFVAATGYTAATSGCDWRQPGFEQTGTDPVVCVSWDDAKAYVAWLSRKTGHTYRLLSEAEWEYAARAGTTTAYWWGDDIGVNRANCKGCGSQWDGKWTSPVGSFAANPFGLYDMLGDVWSWIEDTPSTDYSAAPADGTASTGGDFLARVLRGGSWMDGPAILRSAARGSGARLVMGRYVGFRVARSL